MNLLEERAGVQLMRWGRVGGTGRSGIVMDLSELDGRILVDLLTETGGNLITLGRDEKLTPTDPAPWVGLQGYRTSGSDRYPMEVIEVGSHRRTVAARELDAVCPNPPGAFDDREHLHLYTSNINNEVRHYSWRKQGWFVERGSGTARWSSAGHGSTSTRTSEWRSRCLGQFSTP